MLNHAIFYLFAGLAVVSAILVVTVRNTVHSAIFLITALLATAGIFLQLQAQFLFIVQIILYIGGIMVLFVFVIMLVNLDVALHQVRFNKWWVVSLSLAVVLSGEVGVALKYGSRAVNLKLPEGSPVLSAQNTEAIGKALFENYMLPFEIASILLLVAMIGAVVMSKKRI
jgi:NADH-quinone oxidoreductase subunit J